MSRATSDGYFVTTDEAGREHRFVARKGAVIPPGAAFVAAEDAGADAAETETAPKPAARKGKVGPSETSDAAGPSETS